MHTALGGDPNHVGELSRVVVHAAREHERQAVLHSLAVKDVDVGDGVHALVGKACGGLQRGFG